MMSICVEYHEVVSALKQGADVLVPDFINVEKLVEDLLAEANLTVDSASYFLGGYYQLVAVDRNSVPHQNLKNGRCLARSKRRKGSDWS